MAGSFTDFLENELLDHVFGNAAYQPSGTLHVGLSTTTISDDGTGDTEPVGNNYARASVTNNATNWPAAAAGAKANGTDITFNQASGSWGTITYFAIYDHPTGGNMLGYGDLTTSKTIVNGDTPKFSTGDLDITLG